jgi:hypothetical protein
LIIALFNKVDTKKSIPETIETNVNNLIGCLDYDYSYKLNVPATMTFYVLDKNNEDNEGFFKVITTDETEGETILHCGNSYFLIVSASGYKDYTEKIPVRHFKPLINDVHEINLERA